MVFLLLLLWWCSALVEVCQIGGYRPIIISRILSDGQISWYLKTWSETESVSKMHLIYHFTLHLKVIKICQ
jgi:hypothetical protein